MSTTDGFRRLSAQPADPIRFHLAAVSGRILPGRLERVPGTEVDGIKWLRLAQRPELSVRVPGDPYASMLGSVQLMPEPFSFDGRRLERGALLKLFPGFSWQVTLWNRNIGIIDATENGRTFLGHWKFTP